MTVITDYIKQAPKEQQDYLNQIYKLSKKLLPEAEEKISYSMPTFYQNGNVMHFAAMKNHLGFYPTPEPIVHFEKELKPYKTSKGAIQFKYSEPLPLDLIKQIILYIKQSKEVCF